VSTILFSSCIRTQTYKKHWSTLVKVYGQSCYYCGEFATCIDHIIPVSYGGGNDIENLVLSCSWCNLLASDRVFESLEEKCDYILIQRSKKRKVTRTICTDCLLPFEYRVSSPSLFLCAECYDKDEGKRVYSVRPVWKQWLATLELAGVPVEAHRLLRASKFVSHQQKLISLVQFAYYGEM
jgi:hypothetical protein